MAQIIPNEGEAVILENAMKTTTPEALYLRCYSNNYDTINTTTSVAFTEATIAGYGQKTLTRAGFSSATGGSPSSIQYGTPQVFTFTGTGVIVGYYLVGVTSGKVYSGERLYPAAGNTFNSGDTLTITPRITLASVTND
jgi:hypothetical protein